MIMPQNSPASCCNFTRSYVLLIRISAKFDVDLCVTFLNFQSKPKSNDLVNTIIPQKLHVPCCSFTGIFSTSEISTTFYVDPYATFLNFQCSSRLSCLVKLITPQTLPALCCNFTRVFFTYNSWNSSILTFGQVSRRSGCLLQSVTLGTSPMPPGD